jgi:hypothetical protein
MSCDVNTLDLRESSDRLDEDDIGILAGLFLCKQTPPSAQRNPVMLAHSFIWSWKRKNGQLDFVGDLHKASTMSKNSHRDRGRRSDAKLDVFPGDGIHLSLDSLLLVHSFSL